MEAGPHLEIIRHLFFLNVRNIIEDFVQKTSFTSRVLASAY